MPLPPRPMILAATEPNLASVGDTFPHGIELAWCLVTLPADVTDGDLHVILMPDPYDPARSWTVRSSGSVAKWQAGSDGFVAAGAGCGGVLPPGCYRWQVKANERLLGEAVFTIQAPGEH